MATGVVDQAVEQKEDAIKEFHEEVKNNVETNNNDRYIEEEENMGGTYIVGNKLKEYTTEISPEINAYDLRGQYFPKSSLEDSYQSHELETETGTLNGKQNVPSYGLDPIYITQFLFQVGPVFYPCKSLLF